VRSWEKGVCGFPRHQVLIKGSMFLQAYTGFTSADRACHANTQASGQCRTATN